ncbi:fatty acid desaturase [Apiospora arundinis]
MAAQVIIDPNHTRADKLILESLAADLELYNEGKSGLTDNAAQHGPTAGDKDALVQLAMDNMNNPNHKDFEPAIFNSWDYPMLQSKQLNRFLLRPYTRVAQGVVRNKVDVVMFTHLLLYFFTSVPSALALFFWNFSWLHGILHFVMQVSYTGTYTLMMHQHIHGNGILKKTFPYSLFDYLFPYITDPLMGHTWNSYFFHHVKHHHVEGNGPDDLSSTIRYQRDSWLHFAHYVGRFYFFAWLELPIYFIRKGRPFMAARSTFWELGNYFTLYALYQINPRATICVFLLPLALMRLGLMAGNWGQHAFVDNEEPDSDYRSSITVIDVQSNRHSFNDGYHTSHHLNPLRHWREHPNSFFKTKDTYASQDAIVLHNIDYIMITIRTLMKDYHHLAKCMIPIGEAQMAMSLDERAKYLQRRTRRFTEEEIRAKFGKAKA